MKKDTRNFLEATATLIGCIIGAGIFGIPYVVVRSGFLTSLIDFLIVGIAILMIHLYIGEITLRTKGKHQLTGFAEKYLGKNGKALMLFAMLSGNYGALIAYMIGEGKAIKAIFGIPEIYGTLIFFVGMAILVWFGLKVIRKWELYLSALMIFVVMVICFICLGKINLQNLMVFKPGFESLFVPYGVLLFACVGTVAIPDLEVEVRENKKLLKRAIIVGTIIPLLIYLFFGFCVVGVTGSLTTEVATVGLGKAIGTYMVLLGNIFAIFAMATSFLVLALGLKWVFRYDYKFGNFNSWALTCFIPLIVVLSKITTFVKTISIAGAVAGGLEGILIVLMHRRAKKYGDKKFREWIKPRILIDMILIFIFIGGIIYTIFETMKVI